MSTSLATMIRLRAVQNKTRQLFTDMNDLAYRLQFHPDLSSMGWHLGHGIFIENYWLHEVIANNKAFTADDSLFIPENCPRPERGPRLPPLQQLLAQAQEQQDSNALLLIEKIPPLSQHPLFKDEYIENFLIQHYAQHYETLHMALTQMCIKQDKGDYQPEQPLTSQALCKSVASIEQGLYPVGGEWPFSYDNELPAHETELQAFHIAHKPVTNAEFCWFMEQDGYNTESLWSKEGWQWKTEHNIQHPDHWKQNPQQQWYGIKHDGAYTLEPDTPVHGISHYEACAFARMANARLPHEHEWETAVRLGIIQNTASTWEWCHNTFYAYEGFKAFPYHEYSTPWFNEPHYVLRGASAYTRPEIKRAAFRNFYQPHQRHMFAGLRLVFA